MGDKNSGGSSVVKELSVGGIFWRFGASLVLVLATYNPSQYSYFQWVSNAMSNDSLGPPQLFVGVLLLISWAIFLVATFNALGRLGTALAVAFFASLIWMLADWGILATDSMSAKTWIVLVCLAGLLAIGLSWAHIWRRMTGQFDTED
jgi:hypothetical protein